jgi:hypothetical protein
MTTAKTAIRFIQSLKVPTGPLAGRKVKLAPFQRQFIEGVMGVNRRGKRTPYRGDRRPKGTP